MSTNTEKAVIPVIKVFGLPPSKDYKSLKLAIANMVMDMKVESKYAGIDIYLIPDLAQPTIIDINILIEMSFVGQAYVPVLRAVLDLIERYFGSSVRIRGQVTFLNNAGSVTM